MILQTALAAAALGGEPQCQVSLPGCYFSFSDSNFGNPWFTVNSAGVPYNETIVGSTKKHACNKQNWLLREQCNTNCPLRLRITKPEHMQMTVCVQDSVFSPYDADAHLDLDHRLNGGELELIAAGTPGSVSRHGCTVADFQDGRDYEGKLILISRGTCYFFEKFIAGHKVKGAAALMVNSRTQNSIYDQMFSMSGPSTELPGFVSAMTPNQYGLLLFEALDRGEKVFGKYELNCDPIPEPSAEEIALDDGCPTGKLEEVCLDAEADEDRLCASCPAEMTFQGVSGCMRGNFLLPRRKENYFQHTLTFPANVEDIHWITDLPNGGCSQDDFKGFEGKVVMIVNPQSCPHFQAARYASAEKVAGFINYELQPRMIHTNVEGVSPFVNMPVHGMNAEDSIALQEVVVKHGTAFTLAGGQKGYKFNAVMDVGPTRPRPAKVDKVEIVVAEAAAPEEIAAFQWSAAVVISLILIIILFFALVVLYLHQRANAVEIPSSEGNDDGFALPLGLANMGLALTLLVIIAVVAFALAYQAGQDATDTAVKDGNKAASITYENAVGNVNELAKGMREGVINQVAQSIRATLEDGEAAANGACQIYIGFDGTWKSFYSQLAVYINYAASVESRWLTNVFTTRGFFASKNFITDDRPDDERKDGVNGSVMETDAGWLYGANAIWYSPAEYIYYFWANNHRLEHNASRMLGGHWGDPLATVEGQPRGFAKWHITKESFANIEEYVRHPVSVFTPLYDRGNVFRGVVEARVELTTLANLVSRAASGEGLQNLTLVVYLPEDKMVIATNAWYNEKHRGQVVRVGYREMRGFYTLYDLPPVHVSAATRYIDSEIGAGVWSVKGDSTLGKEPGFSGVFDQKQHYTGTPLTVFKIRPVNGVAKDIGGDEWDPEMRDGPCGACVGEDNGRAVFDMDGESILYIKKNLTTRVPMVAETKVPTADGSWKSSKYDFETLKNENGEECVAYDDFVSPTSSARHCLVRGNLFANTGYTSEGYTVHMKVKPNKAYTEAQWTQNTPHLFTDRSLGETNVRVWANGQMQINILGYGCKTQAPEGGIPAGVWTSITATKSPSRCMVYINGTLNSAGTVANGYSLGEHGEPLLVGRYYEGQIDNINVYNYSVSSTEAMSIHETGELVRDVPSRDWYVDVRALDEDIPQQREGVDWQVMAMLPKDDVMRQVDRNNDITMRNLKVQEDNTQKRLTQKNNETIMIVVLIAMASVFVFLVFNDALTKPFAQTAIVMTDAAVMRIEQVDEKHSFLLELNAMNRAMSLMCKNLKEFKSYMPQTLGLDDESDEASEESISKSKSKASRSKQSGGSMASFMSKNAAASQAAETAVAANQKRQGLVLSLQRKKVSFCINNVAGWFRGTQQMSDSALVKLHGEVLTMTLSAFQINKGVSEVFSGDRFVASFNAAKNCGTHRTAAVAAGFQINSSFRDLHKDKFTMHTACVSGDGRVGNCGNEQMKKYTFMTPVLTWGYGLERIANRKELSLLADSYIYDDASNSFSCKVVMDVQFHKRNKNKPVRVAHVVGKKQGGDSDEWMYELEDAAAKDPYSKWNAYADAVLGQNWEEANKHETSAKALDEGSAFQYLNAQHQAQMAEPLELIFH